MSPTSSIPLDASIFTVVVAAFLRDGNPAHADIPAAIQWLDQILSQQDASGSKVPIVDSSTFVVPFYLLARMNTDESTDAACHVYRALGRFAREYDTTRRISEFYVAVDMCLAKALQSGTTTVRANDLLDTVLEFKDSYTADRKAGKILNQDADNVLSHGLLRRIAAALARFGRFEEAQTLYEEFLGGLIAEASPERPAFLLN